MSKYFLLVFIGNIILWLLIVAALVQAAWIVGQT